jgi:NADH-ubiquinone oxidoreductase chain 4
LNENEIPLIEFFKYILLFKIYIIFIRFFFPKFLLISLCLIIFFLNPNIFYSKFLSLDQIRDSIILLSILVLIICLWTIKSSQKKLKLLSYLIFLAIILFFSTNHLLLFYFIFELRLLPILLIVLGWGYQIERIQSSFFLLRYILIFSFPFFIILIKILFSFNLYQFINYNIFNSTFFIRFFILRIFFSKCPIYLFHLWLPKAHVEASVTGSIILAGIILKLGGYGIYRLIFLINFYFRKFIFFFILIGTFLAIIFCLLQRDLKSIIAYRRVNHITLIGLGILVLSQISIKGALLLIIAHGFTSRILFFIINSFYYSIHSRLFYLIQNSISILKILSTYLFLLFVLNLNFPFLLTFFREIYLFYGIILNNKIRIFLCVILRLITCFYTIFILWHIIYGKIKINISFFKLNIKSSYILIRFIFICLNLIIIISWF